MACYSLLFAGRVYEQENGLTSRDAVDLSVFFTF